MLLTASMKQIRKYGRRVGLGLAALALAAGTVVFQQQREAWAQGSFLTAREQTLAQQELARQLGLESSEIADLTVQEESTAGALPPAAFPLFNQARLEFFWNAQRQELQLRDLLAGRQQRILAESRSGAAAAVRRLGADLDRARRLGVEDELLAAMTPALRDARADVRDATTVREFRQVASELKAPLSRLELLIADQEATNAAIQQYASEAAAQDHGDPGLARDAATAALDQIQADLDVARLFQMDVSVVEAKLPKLSAALAVAQTASELDLVTGGLKLRDRTLQQAMAATLPAKAITISLQEQTLRALDHGQTVFTTYVTTGRPGLETDRGTFKVYWKVTPWVMHSPWPKESPFWYPDTPVRTVMWFNGGEGIHDASWRAYYGPGTNFQHYDPLGATTGTHGCVNVPARLMGWLWDWTPAGTPVIVY